MYNLEKVKECEINRLTVKNGELKIRSYDKHITIITEVNIDGLKIESEDRTVFIGQKQMSSIKLFLSEGGTMEISDSIICKNKGKYKAQYALEEINADMELDGQALEIDIAKLKKASKFSGRKNCKRAMLKGVNLSSLGITATDSFILFNEEGNYPNITIPNEFIDCLQEGMQIKYTDKAIIAKTPEKTIYSRLMEGSYPSVEKLLKSHEQALLTQFNTQQALKVVALVENIGCEYVEFKKGVVIGNNIETVLEKEFEGQAEFSAKTSAIATILQFAKTNQCFYKSERDLVTFQENNEIYMIVPTIKRED